MGPGDGGRGGYVLKRSGVFHWSFFVGDHGKLRGYTCSSDQTLPILSAPLPRLPHPAAVSYPPVAVRHRLPYVQPTDIKIDKRAGTPAASTFKDLVSGGIKVKSERFDSGAHPEELWRRAPGSLLATDKLYLVDKSATTWSKDYSQCDTFGSTARVASVDGSAAMPIGDLTNTEQSVNFDLATVSTAHTNKAFRMCIKCTNCKVLHDIDLTGALHKFFVTDLNSNSESTQVSSKVCTGYSRLPTPFVFPVVPPTPDLPSILSPPPPPRPPRSHTLSF